MLLHKSQKLTNRRQNFDVANVGNLNLFMCIHVPKKCLTCWFTSLFRDHCQTNLDQWRRCLRCFSLIPVISSSRRMLRRRSTQINLQIFSLMTVLAQIAFDQFVLFFKPFKNTPQLLCWLSIHSRRFIEASVTVLPH